MSEVINPLQDKFRKYFVIILALFSAIMIGVLNFRYDSLSRYPYRDQQSRKKIKEKLNKEEMEYIIEYSIAPNMFISFIDAEGFNIYHIEDYKKLSEYCWDKSPQEVVNMVEETREDLNVDELIHFLGQYHYDELKYYLENGDPYSQGTVLVDNANDIDAYVSPTRSVSVRVPKNLLKLPESITLEEKYLSEDAYLALNSLCTALNAQYRQSQGCGGLSINKAYVSYTVQEKLFEEKGTPYESYPGHDEHQLGLAVDFGVDGVEDQYLPKTEQGQWLKENAWRFGFIQTYTEDTQEFTGHIPEEGHYRYVGEELARMLSESGMSFSKYELNKLQ